MANPRQKAMERLLSEDGLKDFAQRIRSPRNVLRVKNRKELQNYLDLYNTPLLPGRTVHTKRFFMEYVRPTLIYYCHKFGVQLPPFLAQEGHYGHGAGGEGDAEQLGEGPLQVRDWNKFIEGHAEHGGEEGAEKPEERETEEIKNGAGPNR